MQAAAGPGTQGSDSDEDTEWMKDAVAAAGKKIEKALPIVNEALSEAKNYRSSMKRQLTAATFFTNNREFQWSVPILESLSTRIENTSLEQWEPDFCAEVWELLLKGYDGKPKGVPDSEKELAHKYKILKKLFEVNVEKAAALTPKQTQK